MKNNKLLLSSALLTGAIMFSASIYLKNNANFKSSTNQKLAFGESELPESHEREDAAGAAQWLFNIQKNPATGVINPLDVLGAREEVTRMHMSRANNASLGLDWTELGPDNVGGRTRSILIDKRDATGNTMYAGSVTGGLWISTNGGTNWNNVAGFDQQPNLGISCITQAANGNIYLGTGEDMGNGFYGSPANGNGEPNFIGGGIYISTDGVSFSLLPSTIPTTPNSTASGAGTAFIGVNNIAADPTNSNRIYAATRYGLQLTDDGGTTWTHALTGSVINTRATDVKVASDHTVIAAVSGKLYRSDSGDAGTYSLVSVAGISGVGRIEFAISPTDPNYMYAMACNSSDSKLKGVYQSIDKGLTWALIGNGGSTEFQPLSNQGTYGNTIAVYPGNKTKIIIGGLDSWIWNQTNPNIPGVGQWSQASYWALSSPNAAYLHADIHTIKFHPNNPNAFFVGCDGGVFRGYDYGSGVYYQAMNKGYNVTQFYGIAFEGDDPARLAFVSGAQDNGSNYVTGHGNSTKAAVEVMGGDGAQSEISFLSPNVSFTTVDAGSLARNSTKGSPGGSFYSSVVSSYLTSNGASFVTPISLYETKTAANSPDVYKFYNGRSSQTVGMGDGTPKHFTGTITLPYPSATIVPDSIKFSSGLQIIKDDGAGTLIGSVDPTKTNTINYATGAFDFYFLTAPSNGSSVNLAFDVTYASGSAISITRSEYAYPLNYTATSLIGIGDTVSIYDPFQAKLAVGFVGAVFITKDALNFSITPQWMEIGTISDVVEQMAWSADGDILYVGCANGNLYRFSNLAPVTGIANGDISSPGNIVVKTLIANFSSYVTAISVDPTDPNNLAVSLGNYGTSLHIYYSTVAATCASSSSTTNFSAKQGASTTKLPAMPVYSVLIEQTDPKRVIVGTEYGIFSTPDITVANPVWGTDNGVTGLFPNTPVFCIRQQRRAGNEVYNPGVIYVGSHGRGAWKSETFMGVLGINDPGSSASKSKKNSDITIYPNPMSEQGTIAFSLDATSDISISIYNMEGKLMKTIKAGKLNSGNQKIQITTDEFSRGTYFVSIDGAAIHATSKFVVVK